MAVGVVARGMQRIYRRLKRQGLFFHGWKGLEDPNCVVYLSFRPKPPRGDALQRIELVGGHLLLRNTQGKLLRWENGEKVLPLLSEE